jgi:hypothetical protein
MAVTPAPKARFEKIPARHSPNDPAKISIAIGNHARSLRTHERSLKADVICSLPAPAIEYASAAGSMWCSTRSGRMLQG